MKYLLPLFLLTSSCLVAETQERHLVDYLQNRIDFGSYEFTHTYKEDKKLYYHGYIDAMNHVLHMVTSGKLDWFYKDGDSKDFVSSL